MDVCEQDEFLYSWKGSWKSTQIYPKKLSHRRLILEQYKDISIRLVSVRCLVLEVFKCMNGLSSSYINDLFQIDINFFIWRAIRNLSNYVQTCPTTSKLANHALWASHNQILRIPLQWRHNGHDSVSNHQPHDCLLNGLSRRRSKKTSKLRVTGLCAGNSPGTGEFPAQMASDAENVFIWWHHHAYGMFCPFDIKTAYTVSVETRWDKIHSIFFFVKSM